MRNSIIVSCLSIFMFFACRKDSTSDADQLYGRWKTSYGDTITFSKENNRNLLTYDQSLNPAMSADTKTDFRFVNDKLEIKRFAATDDFVRLDTLKWIEAGRSFEIQGVEWFLFISSTTTYFTFTRID